MTYERIFIRPDQYQKIKQLAEEQNKTIIEIMDVILNKEEPKEEKTPIITKCLWNYYYWKAKSKDEDGRIEWEKVDECPILSVFPDILTLPPTQRINALMKACQTCIVKEKSLKQKERKKERKRQYFKEYGTYKSHEYEPDYKLY
jgi:hypothetical protein